MLLVVGLAFDFPEVGTHGLFAIRLVLLCEEGGLVGGDFRQVFLTGLDRCCYRCETVAGVHLTYRRRRGTGDALQGTDVHTRAMFAGCRRYAVGSQNHLLVVGVLRLFVDFGKRSRNGFVECYRSCYCHSLLAMTRTTARSALV